MAPNFKNKGISIIPRKIMGDICAAPLTCKIHFQDPVNETFSFTNTGEAGEQGEQVLHRRQIGKFVLWL